MNKLNPSAVMLPQFLIGLIENAPRSGDGVHSWLFTVARHLHKHMPADKIVAFLEQKTADCGRFVPLKEILSAVKNSMACAWKPSQRATAKPAPKWPAVNQERSHFAR